MVDSLNVSARAEQSVSAAERGRVTELRNDVESTERELRTKIVSVRMTDSEWATVVTAARVAGKHPASWIRDVSVLTARGRAGEPKAGGESVICAGDPDVGQRRETALLIAQAQMQEVMKARAVLAAIGNNVNQIAKAVNAGQPLESEQAVAVFGFLRAKVNLLDAEVHRLRAVTAS